MNTETCLDYQLCVAAFNEVPADVKCPRCGGSAMMVIDLYFGLRDQIRYSLGQRVQWREGREVQNGGRPPGGDLNGEGYTECPLCKKDFFLVVEIRNDVLVAVRPDPLKKGHIPD